MDIDGYVHLRRKHLHEHRKYTETCFKANMFAAGSLAVAAYAFVNGADIFGFGASLSAGISAASAIEFNAKANNSSQHAAELLGVIAAADLKDKQ